jgi:glycine cleavage system aminomethyltransferase T
VLCARITYVGELGYELYIPTESAVHVYERIVEAGRSFDLTHAGLRALGSLRLEKGYRDFGHDMDNTDTVLQVGLGFTCDFNKAFGFIGKDAVLEQKKLAEAGGGLKKRLAQVLVQDEEPLLHHGEVLWRNGVRISEIRSASYAHTLGGAVGLCLLESDCVPITKSFITDGDWSVEIGNRMYPCTVSLRPLYDPKNEKIKA